MTTGSNGVVVKAATPHIGPGLNGGSYLRPHRLDSKDYRGGFSYYRFLLRSLSPSSHMVAGSGKSQTKSGPFEPL